MVKKILLLFVVLAFGIGYLQVFGHRDFSQMSLAWDNYSNGGSFSELISGIGAVISGGNVIEPDMANSKYANDVVYRWKDESGQTHLSETKPRVTHFETIRVGDLKLQTQKGLTQDEIDQALQPKNDSKK